MKYINKDIKGIYADFDFELDGNYSQGSTLDDFKAGKWIKLSDEQIAFQKANPNAKVEEVLNMKLDIPSEDELLERAKKIKIAEIEEYDVSQSVNDFTINKTIHGWLTPDERTSYMTSINSVKALVAAKLRTDNVVTFNLGGVQATISTDSAIILLAQIQVYADACWLVTKNHINDVNALTTVADVEAYDITLGYPTKVNVTL